MIWLLLITIMQILHKQTGPKLGVPFESALAYKKRSNYEEMVLIMRTER